MRITNGPLVPPRKPLLETRKTVPPMSLEIASVILGSMLAAILGLSGWTLYTVHTLATGAAAREQHDAAQDQSIRENRARIMDVENDMGELKVKVGRLEERAGIPAAVSGRK